MEIEKNTPLANKNWFKTGGPAKFFCEPQTNEECFQAAEFAKKIGAKTFVLGHGANILISDEGFDGLIIKPHLNNLNFDLESQRVTAGAGISINDLIEKTLKNGLAGLEVFSGIPGTVGGATAMNIHYFESELSDFVVEAEIVELSTGKIFKVDKKWFDFGYGKSALLSGLYMLLQTTFQLKKVSENESAFARGRAHEIIRHRSRRYPPANTCGSFFKNFDTEREVQFIKSNTKVPYVAYYLDQLGIKGALSVGGAAVWHSHANMIVSSQGAKSSDIISLACKMQKLVEKNFGIIPKPECQLIGFKTNPLQELCNTPMF